MRRLCLPSIARHARHEVATDTQRSIDMEQCHRELVTVTPQKEMFDGMDSAPSFDQLCVEEEGSESVSETDVAETMHQTTNDTMRTDVEDLSRANHVNSASPDELTIADLMDFIQNMRCEIRNMGSARVKENDGGGRSEHVEESDECG